VIRIHLGDRPNADMATADALIERTSQAASLIAVGSGTINDLCKFAAARQSKRCAVFATAPSMNGYTSVNAAISEHGLKKSLSAVAPEGVFMDLKVLAEAPVRMIRSGLGDSVCRPTAQADWLLSHFLFDDVYRQAPFVLLADDEEALLAEPEALVSGDLEAMRRLARTLVLSGFGMTLCGGSYPASQGEHLISHTLEMKPPPGWEESFHGEQIAVTTCVMARLQKQILTGPSPRLSPTKATISSLTGYFGSETGAACWKEFQLKRISIEKAEQINARLERNWDEIQETISNISIAPDRIAATLSRAGAPVSFTDIGLGRDFFSGAIVHAREIRNRYTFLDLAADANRLDVGTLL
jgi:glycerol-1-phosphate dehydrogenase [NAD(P)+]